MRMNADLRLISANAITGLRLHNSAKKYAYINGILNKKKCLNSPHSITMKNDIPARVNRDLAIDFVNC